MPILVSDVTDLIPIELGLLPDALIQSYIDIVTTEADLQLNNIFANPFSTVVEADCINYTTQNVYGTNIVSIGAWQPTGLTLKIAHEKDQNTTVLEEEPLVLGEDYIYWYGWKGKKIPGLDLPVTNIRLLCRNLANSQILRVYGTYGWQEGYPSDVKQALVNVIVSLAGYAQKTANESGVTGAVREKSMTTEVEYSDIMAEQLRNQARDFLNDPAFVAIIRKYNLIAENNIAII